MTAAKRNPITGRLESSHPPGEEIKHRMNWGETDKDTRGSGRNSVTMLPARRTIINVYQLISKIKGAKSQSGGKKDNGGKTKNPHGWGFDNESSRIVVDTVDGEEINKYFIPVRKVGADGKWQSWPEYKDRGNHFIKTQKDKMNPMYKDVLYYGQATGKTPPNTSQNTNTKKKAKEEEEATANVKHANLKRNINQQHQAEQEKMFNNHKGEPIWDLWKIAKGAGVKHQPTLSKLEVDPSYTQYSPIDDYERINKAITNAKAENRLNEVPPVIVAVKSHGNLPPQWYYIKNNLSFRHRRLIKSKLKRRVAKPAPRKIKRKVVMKKKTGGRR